MALDDVQRRSLATDLFNHVWSLLDQADRTAEDDDRMLHAAHASGRREPRRREVLR